jgi:chromosome segregation ATPase
MDEQVNELRAGNDGLRQEVARLHGEIDALRERFSALDAADEHHRVELESARVDAAEARAELKVAQARLEEWRRQVAEARERQTLAERQRQRAEDERAAVIAALGRRARKHLAQLDTDQG